MTTRRSLIQGATAAMLGAATGSAEALASAASVTGTAVPLEPLLVERLAGELGSRVVAQKLAPWLLDAMLNWSYPQMPVQEADSIVAYSFGNRIPEGALTDAALPGPIPGPINARLAQAVVAIRSARNVPVYAQWEIATLLQDTYRMDRVVPIYPERDASGKEVYLSTEGVAKAVVHHAGSASALGRVAVVGHRDHVKRCIIVSRASGMAAAAAVSGVALPIEYDPLSGQAWTRSRDLYLLGDVLAQLAMTRARLLADHDARS